MQSVETVIGCLGLSHRSLFHSLDWVHRLWCKFLSDGWDSRLSACTRSSCQLKNTLHPGTRILWKQWSCWSVMWARPLPTPTNRWLLTALLTVCLPSFRSALWWSVLLGLDCFFAFFLHACLSWNNRDKVFFPQSLRPGRICNWMCVVEILFRKKHWLWEACGFFHCLT